MCKPMRELSLMLSIALVFIGAAFAWECAALRTAATAVESICQAEVARINEVSQLAKKLNMSPESLGKVFCELPLVAASFATEQASDAGARVAALDTRPPREQARSAILALLREGAQ